MFKNSLNMCINMENIVFGNKKSKEEIIKKEIERVKSGKKRGHIVILNLMKEKDKLDGGLYDFIREILTLGEERGYKIAIEDKLSITKEHNNLFKEKGYTVDNSIFGLIPVVGAICHNVLTTTGDNIVKEIKHVKEPNDVIDVLVSTKKHLANTKLYITNIIIDVVGKYGLINEMNIINEIINMIDTIIGKIEKYNRWLKRSNNKDRSKLNEITLLIEKIAETTEIYAQHGILNTELINMELELMGRELKIVKEITESLIDSNNSFTKQLKEYYGRVLSKYIDEGNSKIIAILTKNLMKDEDIRENAFLKGIEVDIKHVDNTFSLNELKNILK